MKKTQIKKTKLIKSNYSLKKTKIKIKEISKERWIRISLRLERKAFDSVYKNHNWKCILTGRQCDINRPENFPHYLSKYWYPHLRLSENNIWLVCNSEYHDLIDIIIRKLEKEIWYWVLEKRILSWEDISDDIKRIYKWLKE